MKRLGPVWLIFGLCVALAAGAMARVGGTALSLERAEAKDAPAGRSRREPAARALANGLGARRP